ncbi:uncharacterized protein PFLUO_LOCUS4066 [Penicillium psychrofluorescens]|uniref:uncharacterized protein n=1 Tax=Penicillium psychrofluorescens TaxID=3158075 RepID=UPI003CCDE10A
MAPIVYLIRHGQAEHNVNISKDSHKRPDPGLTATGEEQSKDLCTIFPHHEKISLILASPLKRTVQTAAYTFGPILRERQVPLILVPAAQEIGAFGCDIGQEADALRIQAPEWIREAVRGYDMQHLNMDLIQEGWNRKEGVYAATLAAVREREAALRSWLFQRPESHIALVTHGAFLHYLTDDWATYDRTRGTRYKNCEYRQFEFTSDSNLDDAHLREVGGTRERQRRPSNIEVHVFNSDDLTTC